MKPLFEKLSDEELTIQADAGSYDFHEYWNPYFVTAFKKGYRASEQRAQKLLEALELAMESLSFYAERGYENSFGNKAKKALQKIEEMLK